MILEQKEQKQKTAQEDKRQRGGWQKQKVEDEDSLRNALENTWEILAGKNDASHVKAWACGKERNDLEKFLRQVAFLSKTKNGDKVEDRVRNQPQQEKEARPHKMK